MRIDVKPKTAIEQAEEYRKYYSGSITDVAKGTFISFLKERRDRYGDVVAGQMVQELGEKFLTERWRG